LSKLHNGCQKADRGQVKKITVWDDRGQVSYNPRVSFACSTFTSFTSGGFTAANGSGVGPN
jgi:hypothetical protein